MYDNVGTKRNYATPPRPSMSPLTPSPAHSPGPVHEAKHNSHIEDAGSDTTAHCKITNNSTQHIEHTKDDNTCNPDAATSSTHDTAHRSPKSLLLADPDLAARAKAFVREHWWAELSRSADREEFYPVLFDEYMFLENGGGKGRRVLDIGEPGMRRLVGVLTIAYVHILTKYNDACPASLSLSSRLPTTSEADLASLSTHSTAPSDLRILQDWHPSFRLYDDSYPAHAHNPTTGMSANGRPISPLLVLKNYVTGKAFGMTTPKNGYYDYAAEYDMLRKVRDERDLQLATEEACRKISPVGDVINVAMGVSAETLASGVKTAAESVVKWGAVGWASRNFLLSSPSGLAADANLGVSSDSQAQKENCRREKDVEEAVGKEAKMGTAMPKSFTRLGLEEGPESETEEVPDYEDLMSSAGSNDELFEEAKNKVRRTKGHKNILEGDTNAKNNGRF